MLNSYYKLSVPEELVAYYNVTSPVSRMSDKSYQFDSDLIVCRDARGCVTSVKYLTPDKELLKEVFYKGESVCKINHYRANKLYSTEGYKEGLLVLKFIFKASGHLAYSIEYEYRDGNMTSIRKKCDGRDILIEYHYDDFGKISERVIYLNNTPILEQNYNYDNLGRIVEYSDNNQHIEVYKISDKHELISYEITDKMGNVITIENHFTESGYVCTDLIVNGHSAQVKDTSYVDNIMLKKPYTSEDDLDFIIANLFQREDTAHTKNETGTVGNVIEQRVLPLSMRKRLLYSMASKV